MGNATNGKVFELKAAADALNASLAEHPNPDAHTLLSEIQQWACDGAGQAKSFTKDCEQIMP